MKQKILILILFCLILLVIPRAKADISTGLVGYWRLDEGSGTSAFDFSGNGLTGTVTESVFVEGKYGAGLRFDGTNDKVDIPNNALFQFTQSFSLCFWSKLESGNITGIEKSNAYYIYWDGTNALFGRSYNNTAISGTVLVSSGWHFLVFTHNINGNETLFSDGVQIATAVSVGNLTTSNTQTFKVGGYVLSGYRSGTIDEVRVYSSVLSVQDVLDLYQGFNIVSSSDLGITISPLGDTTVGASQSETFSILPKTGYSLNTLFVDGVLQGIASGSYTFSNTVSNHTIYATSFLLPQNPTNIDVNYYLFGGGRYVGLILVIIALFLVNFLHKYSFLITVSLAFLLTLLYLRQTPPLVWEGILTLFVGLILMLTGVLKIRR